jgi:ABC-2 type transport system ATP-binding protein
MSSPDFSELAISVSGLNKWIEGKQILKDVDIHIPYGSITGFVGPNGTGKTSTMKALLALNKVDSGEGEVAGFNFNQPEKYLSKVGALIETPAFYPNASAQINLQIFAALAQAPQNSIADLLSLVGLQGTERKNFSQFSLGMKQKLGIAAALLKSPEILILDEPVNGLDPEAVIDIRRILEHHRDKGTCILISSHLLAELELISDRFIFIDNGEISFSGTKEELFESGEKRIILKPEYGVDLYRLMEKLVQEKFEVRACEDFLELVMNDSERLCPPAEISRMASRWGIWFDEICIKSDSLEERFFAV